MEIGRAALWAELRDESLIAPSLLSADFVSLGDTIDVADQASKKKEQV